MPTVMNYTTTIAAEKTLGELQRLLIRAGARAISVEYDPSGAPNGLAFRIKTASGDRDYRLPLDLGAVLKLLQRASQERDTKSGRARLPSTWVTKEHASRVGWRIMKDWVEAQLALVQVGLASMEQTMFAYQLAEGQGRTVYELYEERALTLPKPVAD